MKRTMIGLLGLVLALALAMTGCNKVSGGGWIPSASNSNGKATFGFNFKCDPETGVTKGQFQYTDHVLWNGKRVQFHAEPLDFPPDFNLCALGPLAPYAGLYGGTYTAQGTKAPEGIGNFVLGVVDFGEPGPSTGDLITLTLIGGPFDGYTNEQYLGGGNIQAPVDLASLP